MPTTISGRKTNTMAYSESTDGGKTFNQLFTSPWEYNEAVRVWPDTTKRKKPVDGFLNGTGRQVQTVYNRDSGFSHIVRTYPMRRYQNASVQSAFYVSGRSVDAMGVINDELVYNKIRADIRGQATNLAQMLAEYAETAKLFMDLAKIVTTKGKSLFRQVPRGALSGSKVSAYSKVASGAYLQWTYGISPLCGDMASAIRELRNRMDHPLYIGGVESRTVTGTHNGQVGFNGLGSVSADCAIKEVERRRYQWRAYVNKNALLHSMFAHGFGNPLAVGYELVPFSFVVDWWVNIGEVLASLDNLVLVDSIYVIKSTSRKRIELVQTRPGPDLVSAGASTRYTRTDTRLAPATISRVSSFQYDPSVSYRHILNGLALLNQLRR